MKMRLVARRLAASLLISLCTLTGAQSASSTPLLDHLVVVESEFQGSVQEANGSQRLRAMVDQAAGDLGQRQSLGTGADIVRALNHLVFNRLAIRATQDLKDPGNLMPAQVLQRKQGYCVGIASLYLLVTERLDLPIFAVATPSHVFLRYDDGSTRINIETQQRGANVGDEQYIREQKIPEESIRRGVFMRNLTTDEFLAQVHNNLGVIYSERQEFQEAASEYEAALDLDSRLAATFYNWGNDLLRQGIHRKAIRRFSKSLRLYPTDVWALNNRGLAYLKAGKLDKARRDFEAALTIDPGFEQARRNLEGMSSPR